MSLAAFVSFIQQRHSSHQYMAWDFQYCRAEHSEAEIHRHLLLAKQATTLQVTTSLRQSAQQQALLQKQSLRLCDGCSHSSPELGQFPGGIKPQLASLELLTSVIVSPCNASQPLGRWFLTTLQGGTHSTLQQQWSGSLAPCQSTSQAPEL